jgi:hypothetical protein
MADEPKPDKLTLEEQEELLNSFPEADLEKEMQESGLYDRDPGFSKSASDFGMQEVNDPGFEKTGEQLGVPAANDPGFHLPTPSETVAVNRDAALRPEDGTPVQAKPNLAQQAGAPPLEGEPATRADLAAAFASPSPAIDGPAMFDSSKPYQEGQQQIQASFGPGIEDANNPVAELLQQILAELQAVNIKLDTLTGGG